MIRNPELQRNLWIKLSPHRLIATPIVSVLLLALMISTAEHDWQHPASVTATLVFLAATVLWGSRRAYDAIVDEVRDHTWDTQRMSALTPLEMTLGKLFGGTAFNWYVGAHGLAVLVFTFEGFGPFPLHAWSISRLCGLLVLTALLVQALGLLSGLTAVRTGRTIKPARNLPTAVLLLLLALGLGPMATRHAEEPVTWYGTLWAGQDFVLASLAVFTVWAWFGAWRLMADLLAVRTLPWGALGFVVFLTFYLCGFIEGSLWGYPSRFAALGAMVGGTAVYVEAWKERRDWIAIRRFLRAWQQEAPIEALQATPSWLVVAAFTLLMAFATAFLPANRPAVPGLSRTLLDVVTLSPLAFTLLMFRDIGLLYFFSLGEHPDRAASTTLVYLVLLYAVLPALLNLAGLGFLAFPPVGFSLENGGIGLGILIAAAHVAVVVALLRQRLVRLQVVDGPQA